MEDEGARPLELDEEHLAAAADIEDAAAGEGVEALPSAPPEQRAIEKIEPGDDAAAEARRERPGDRFDFGQFGHPDILSSGRLICPGDSTKMPLMKIKAIIVLILGWAVPGLGHALQKKFGRAALFFVSILAMTGLGLAMGGRVYPFQTDNPLTILAFFADLGCGLFYGLARLFRWGGGDLARATFEFGTAYIAGAGLLNFLVAIDAYDIGTGKRS